MRVLVIDDDADQLLLRCLLLRRLGFEVFEAVNVATAMDLARAHRPDCAVVDLHLPAAEHGLGLIRGLKELDPQVRILVLTGVSSARLAQYRADKLIDEVIVKGASSAHLVRALRAFEN